MRPKKDLPTTLSLNIQQTMEDNKAKAVFEELDHALNAILAKGLFHSIYKYMLYNSTPCFLSMLRRGILPSCI